VTYLIAVLAAVPAYAQEEPGVTEGQEEVSTYEVDPMAAVVPFGPGEHLTYTVKAGIFNVGSGFMAVEAIDTVRGHPTYRIHWKVKGSVLFGAKKIDDDYTSWLDTHSVMSRRYVRDVDQGSYKARRTYEFYPEELWWERTDVADSGDLASALPLDEISFVYFLRTLPLEVGRTYAFNRYFKEDGNPVRFEVLRRDQTEVGGGKFNTIVIRPVIPGASLFDEGADAEIHLSDDEHRRIVYMKSELGVLGISISLHLEEWEEGQPIYPTNADQG
jgi:hypothetical protein